MADYSTIKGFTIQSLATDPGLPGAAGATWASGTAMNVAKAIMGHAGTQTAGLVFGGSPGFLDTTEKYDGTTWTEVNDLNTGRSDTGGCGTQTAALFVGGNTPPITKKVEEYDGTSWTEKNDLLVANQRASAIGTNTAALFVGGIVGGTFQDTTEIWNGTSWTEVNDLNTARDQTAGGGTTTAALLTGGEKAPSGASDKTEIYDGTSWSEEGDLNTARMQPGGSGISTLFLAYGGYNSQTVSEAWDGSAWTEVADLATGRSELGFGSQGTQAACLATGGSTPGSVYYTNVEEFSGPGSIAQEGQVWYNTTSTVLKGYGQFMSSGTWASGAALPTGYNGLGGFGTSTAAIMAGSPAPTGFSYDGTTWTATPSLNDSGPTRYYPGSLGTVQNAGMILGAEGSNQPSSETWNGSTWTQGNALTTGRDFMGGCGTTTAGMITGGVFPTTTPVANTETYDGTSWSETTNFPTVMMGGQMGGTTTAAINATGANDPPTATMELPCYDWNGSTWSAGPSINTGRHMGGGDSPSASLMLIWGGLTPPSTYRAQTEFYDGTAWTELADLATARRSYGACGTHTAALFAGGSTGGNSDATEEWTSTTSSIKTFTAS